MKYSLRSLMIVVTLAGPLAAAFWFLFPRLLSMFRNMYRQLDLEGWLFEFVIVAWCGVVFTASTLAYRKKRKPALLVSAILAIFALLGWVGLNFILFDYPSR